MMSFVLMLFLIVGAVSATDSINVSNSEDSNIIEDDDNSLSANNKLEISNEVSISQTNIVNSHDDNLGSYPDDEALNSSADSCYGDNNEQIASNDIVAVGENTLNSASPSSDSVVADISSSDFVSADSSSIKSANPISTTLSVSDTHYSKSATYFDVTLKDKSGNLLSGQKITLKVNGKSYYAYTNADGIASVKTASLKVGSYTLALSYGGNSNYSSSSLSKKVKVLSSAIGSDVTKSYRDTSKSYKVTFWKDNKVLANTKVTFKVNGKTYTKTTNSNGVATLKISLAVGKYVITATNPYSKQKVSNKIIVKKEKTAVSSKSKIYLQTKDKGSFTVVLKAKHGALLKDKKVTFTYNKKTVTSRTNKNGEAKITIPALGKGTYKITYKYDGSDNYYASSGSAKLIVKDPTTKLSSKIVVMKYGEKSNFKVKLTDAKGKVLAGKEVKIKLDGKTTVCKTDKNGVAKLSLKNINPGTYAAKYSYSEPGKVDYSHGSKNVIILKLVAKVSAKDVTMKLNDGSSLKVVVKDASGKALNGIVVKSTIKGKSHTFKTDSNGVAKLKITLKAGSYSVKTLLDDPHYKSSPVKSKILIKGNKFIAENAFVSSGKAVYSVKLVNEKNKVVKGKKITFTLNNKNYTSKTNSKGIAKVNFGVLSKGTHKIQFTDGSATGSSKISVLNKVSIKNLVSASKSVKKYISKHKKLPSTVKIDGVSFKTADYLYLAAKAIVNLKAGKKGDITIKVMDNPSKPKAANYLGYLKDYLSVAKKVVKTAEKKGKLPNAVGSKVGAIGYKGLVSAFADILTSYGKKNKMPTYIPIKSLSGGSSSSAGALNSKNKIKDLAPYLAASKNCEVNDAKIKKLVAKLIKGCKTEKEKANAIFKYIRDTLSYSFYYNTKYGAAGTLNAKKGNCVDHAHLTVAMFRAAGLATRYVHGKCTFTSGHTYGHVWAQVLIGKTWTVADATSSRNSLGKVANWNTHSYKLESYSSSISF